MNLPFPVVSVLVCTVFFLLRIPAMAETPAQILQRADVALEAGFPHAVLRSLRLLLEDESLDPKTRSSVLERLARAEIDSGQPGSALVSLDQETGNDRINFWRGQALLASGKVGAAAEVFLTHASSPGAPLRDEAFLGAGRSFAAMGDKDQAVKVLQQIGPDSPVFSRATLDLAAIALDSGNPLLAREKLASLKEVPPFQQGRHSFLKAMARYQQGDPEGALLSLGQLAGEKSVFSERAAVLQAECLMQTGKIEEAEENLEIYLRSAAGKTPRLLAFEKLDQVYALQENPSSSELRRLASDESQPERASQAMYFLARFEANQGRFDEAKAHYLNFLQNHPVPELEKTARLQVAAILLESGGLPEALSLLPALGADSESDFLRGRILHEQGDHAAAALAFENAAGSAKFRHSATFNAAVSSFLAGVALEENSYAPQLDVLDSSGALSARFRLHAALRSASKREPEAGKQLQDLVQILGEKAATPLAEWHFIHLENSESKQILQKVSNLKSTDRQEYLKIFLENEEEIPSSDSAKLRAIGFLEQFPDSPHRGEVRMKLGEIYFASGDYLRAKTEFEQVGLENPGTELATAAWFMAGRSSVQLMDPEALDQSIQYFEQAAGAGGEAEARARFEQALVVSARGQPDEALILLDRVIESSKDSELRAAAWMEKGDTYYSMGVNDPESYRKAVETWRSLSQEPNLGRSWVDQSRTKCGVAFQKLGDAEAALENYLSVLLDEEGRSPGDFWYFKAGFDAAALLESRESWREAIAVYDRLAQMEGPRADEAKSRANRLRLENFLWED